MCASGWLTKAGAPPNDRLMEVGPQQLCRSVNYVMVETKGRAWNDVGAQEALCDTVRLKLECSFGFWVSE